MALTHGYVVGELIYSRADGTDPDRLPDEIPATDVKLTFTPAAKQFVDPDGRLVVLDPIPAAVLADGSVTGDVNEDGTPKVDATAGLWLVVGKYNVTAKGHYRDFAITVTEDHTEANPLILGDAINYTPPGVTVQSVQVPAGATNGQTLGWVDGLAWVTGGTFSDAAVAAIVEDAGSDTHAAVAALAGGGGSVSDWGDIGGDIANQTDLATALAGKAGTAELSTVATTNSYNDLDDKPTIPTPLDPGDFATTAQGAKADTAVQPDDLTGYVTIEDLPTPLSATVYNLGAGWVGPDDTVTTTRPNAQRVMAFGGTTQPDFLVAGDIWVQDTGA